MNIRVMTLILAGASLSAAANPWYSMPVSQVQVKVIDVGYPGETDPHFMNRSADGCYLAVPLNYNTLAPLKVWRVADLISSREQGLVPSVLTRNAEGLSGTTWKGCAIGCGYVIPAPGPTGGLTTSLYLAAGNWSLGTTAQTVQFGSVKTDGLDLSVSGKVFYSNDLTDQNKIHRWSFTSLAVGETYEDEVMLTSALSRIRNLSAYKVNGKELLYYGEGGSGAKAGQVMVVDTTVDPWVEKLVVATSISGEITNVKLSGVSAGAPVLYVLSNEGQLVVYQLKSDGLECASDQAIVSFDKTDLARFSGLSAPPSTGKFCNFEVTDDGVYAFFMYGTNSDCDNPDNKTVLTVVGTSIAAGVESAPFAFTSRFQTEHTVVMSTFLSRFKTDDAATLPKFRSNEARGLSIVVK